MENYLIKFLPSKKTIEVPRDYNLRQAILDCGIDMESACGGVGTCRRCKVQVKSGRIYSKRDKFIKGKEKEDGYVLSCFSKVRSDAVIFIPEKKKVKAKIEEGKFEIDKNKGPKQRFDFAHPYHPSEGNECPP